MESKMAINISNNAFILASSVVSPLGYGTSENFKSILNEVSGLRVVQKNSLKNEFCTSEIEENWLNELFSKFAEPNNYSKLEKMSILAISDAIAQTNLNLLGSDTLMIYCTTKGNINLLSNFTNNEIYLSDFAQKLANYFGFTNTPMIISNACISGTQGIIIAQRLIKSGIYKNIVVIGGDIVSDFTLSGFKAFNALSNQPCRPFDENRLGVNLGEAVAAIILSIEPSIHYNIQVIDGHISNDANHISAPSRTGDGLFSVLTKLSKNITEKIDFISAHGTATRYNDEMESQALYRANMTDIPTQSIKAYFGHTLGAAGVLEAVLGVESLRQNTTIASMGYQTLGTTYQLNIIQKSENKPLKTFIKTASGFGGCNAALLISKL
jgi:3-oxoacyl-[acyl-carrier-protein] synthase I